MPADAETRVTTSAVGQGPARRTTLQRAGCAAFLGSIALSTLPGTASATIAQRITTTTITLPQALEGATNNFCTWGFCTGFSPRLYQAPMVDGRTLVGWTDATGNGHVSRVNGSTIEQTFDFSATPVRGLVVHPDNSFAVLLLNFGAAATAPQVPQNFMTLSLLTASGTTQWTTSLANSTAPIGVVPGAFPNPHTFGGTSIGDSRLGYGGGMYGAYFSVYANPDTTNTSHDGDQYTLVNDSGVIQTGGWNWGLSHSLAELIDYQPDLARLTALGVTDCFPSTAMWADTSADGGPQNSIFAGDGDCGGKTAVQLGQMVAVTGGNWLVAFNAQSEAAQTDALGRAHAAFTGQGVGVVSFNGTYTATAVKWLTTSDPTGVDEFDPVLARIGTSLASNRFLVGWRLQTEGTFNMEVINPSGTVQNPLETVSPTAGWGNRDDSLKSRPDGSISWLQGSAGATTVQLYRYAEVPLVRDFNGDGTSDILWRNSSGEVVTWTIQGGSLTSSADLGNIPTTWTIAGTGDFNGDGTSDILWRNSSGDVVTWFMKGGTLSTSADLGTIPTTWTIAGTGDFNGDGTSDILWRNANGDVVIWFMQKGTINSSADLGIITTDWTIAGTGDFNGDGTTDILWRNANGDTVIWFLKGGAISTSADLGMVPTTWTIAGTGDFNGDGKSDILWRNSNGEVVTWFMNGGTVTSSADFGVIPASFTIAGTGDYNGDGTTDILWRNSSGDVVTWLLQNGAINSSGDLGVIPTSWTISP